MPWQLMYRCVECDAIYKAHKTYRARPPLGTFWMLADKVVCCSDCGNDNIEQWPLVPAKWLWTGVWYEPWTWFRGNWIYREHCVGDDPIGKRLVGSPTPLQTLESDVALRPPVPPPPPKPQYPPYPKAWP